MMCGKSGRSHVCCVKAQYATQEWKISNDCFACGDFRRLSTQFLLYLYWRLSTDTQIKSRTISIAHCIRTQGEIWDPACVLSHLTNMVAFSATTSEWHRRGLWAKAMTTYFVVQFEGLVVFCYHCQASHNKAFTATWEFSIYVGNKSHWKSAGAERQFYVTWVVQVTLSPDVWLLYLDWSNFNKKGREIRTPK